MARLSFLTPIVFFCSVRSGSGKASMLAHLAVYLNSMGRKTSIIDLDRDTPLKIKSTIPKSISITEYHDLAALRDTKESRYQKAFYFTENDQIAYFPAQRIDDPATLFTDTTLRDFILQARSCYDLILINFPSGSEHCQKASELLAKRHLWGNSTPSCILVSQSEQKSLNLIDELLKTSRAMPYQLRENLMMVFNKVPLTVEEQSLLSRHLNPSELKELYGFPHMQIIGNNEEYIYQRNLDKPIVLDNNSLMHQTIATLYRNMGRLGEESTAVAIDPDSFGACLDGLLLEKLTPYLDSIHQAVASKLFLPAHQVQVFLEENASTYRIRVRVSDYENSVIGISSRLDTYKYSQPVCRDFSLFNSVTKNTIPDHMIVAAKQLVPKLTANRIFRFDDSQLWSTKFSPFGNLPLKPNKERYPSPILFKQHLELQEVPSLSHLLGYLGRRKKYRLFSMSDRPHKNSNLTHFFIPPEFSLVYDLDALYQTNFVATLRPSNSDQLSNQIAIPATSAFHCEISYRFNMPDVFARTQALKFENFADEPELEQHTPTFVYLLKDFSFTDSIPEFRYISYIADDKYNSEPKLSLLIPQSMSLHEPQVEEPDYETDSLEIKPDFENHLAPINHHFNVDRSACSYIDASCHFDAPDFSMGRPQFANAIEIKPVVPASVLLYSRLNLDKRSHSYDVFTYHESFEVEYFDKLHTQHLPDQLKLSSTLLDHQLDSNPLKYLDYEATLDITRMQSAYAPDLNTFFRTDYLLKQALYAIQIYTDKIDQFDYLFASNKLKLPDKKLQIQKRPEFSFDVLSVWFKHNKDYSELCTNLDQMYCSSKVVDSSISCRQLSLLKRDMLSIAIPGNTTLKSISASNKKKFSFCMIAPAISIAFNQSLSQPCLKSPETIEYHTIEQPQKFADSIISQPLPAFLFDHQLSSEPYVNLRQTDAAIFVQPVLSRSTNKPEFNAIAQQLDIIAADTTLRQSTSRNYFLHPAARPVFKPENLPPETVVGTPYRSIKFALEPLKNYKDDPSAINNIFTGASQIITQPGTQSQSSGMTNLKIDLFNTVKPLLEQQILFNKLFDLGEHLDQRKANFHVPPPYALDVLYDHLIESSRLHFRKLFDQPVLQNHANDFITDFSAVSSGQTLKNTFNFIHHTVPGLRRRPMPAKTRQLPIRNIKLRDLLKMARQASQQFTQVQGKITA